MIKLHFSLYVLCIGQRECCIFSPSFSLSLSRSLSFLLVRLRAFARISVGGGSRERERERERENIHPTLCATPQTRILPFGRKIARQEAVFFFSSLSLSLVVLCGWM